MSRKFCTVVNSFSFVSRDFFDFFLDIVINPTHCLVTCYSVSMNLAVFEFSSFTLASSFTPL